MNDGTENGLRGFDPKKKKKMGIREAAVRVYGPKIAKAAKDHFLDTSKNYRNMAPGRSDRSFMDVIKDTSNNYRNMPKTHGKKPE
jgi:hypothetical protein